MDVHPLTYGKIGLDPTQYWVYLPSLILWHLRSWRLASNSEVAAVVATPAGAATENSLWLNSRGILNDDVLAEGSRWLAENCCDHNSGDSIRIRSSSSSSSSSSSCEAIRSGFQKGPKTLGRVCRWFLPSTLDPTSCWGHLPVNG